MGKKAGEVSGTGGRRFDDFTEVRYRELLRAARASYAFENFGTQATRPHVLWRHDVDLSINRARRIASIEFEEGVSATYCIMLSGRFYNVLEPEIARHVRALRAMGHSLGLHFDPAAYGHLGSAEELRERILWEQRLLSDIAECDIPVLSFHNPADGLGVGTDADDICGMVNTYGSRLQARYVYCSDSNGYWRHERLFDVIEGGMHERLHVLTHPEWWVAEPMAPRDRVLRCIHGRAEATTKAYDAALQASRRENVGK